MDFRIADTFTDSLARLSGDEQKAVKTTAFDLQLNPAQPGMSLHKLDRTKDKNFWSVRVSGDIRLIIHKTAGSLLLCYVDHHDGAYAWAERRKLEVHPTTGAAQLVEVRERVEEIVIPRYVAAAQPPLFAQASDAVLLGCGVPPEWLADVRAATEDSLLDLADHLPGEAAEALLDLATGVLPAPAPPLPPAASGSDPFAHPDALRRFRMVNNTEELVQALDYPWEKWTVFLHPAQRESVERAYGGPARVSGSAGTGKTIVALHRAVYLARREPDARVLLTTFSDTLANALRRKLKILLTSEPHLGNQIEVQSLDAVALRLYAANLGRPQLAPAALVGELLQEAAEAQLAAETPPETPPETPAGTAAGRSASNARSAVFSPTFLLAEWEHVVDAWQLTAWEGYRDVSRLGRRTRLPDKQRAQLWAIFALVWEGLQTRGLITRAGLFTCLAEHYAAAGRPPYDYIVVDEAQDLSIAQLRLLAALGHDRPDSLFFAGDLGQRIFQQPFSWKALGVDVRGRSRTLRINYRTSHQIRSQADLLLDREIGDVDGNKEDRRNAISIFNGPQPAFQTLATAAEEQETVSCWLAARLAEGVQPHEIGLFVRSAAQLARARAAVEAGHLPYRVLDDSVESVEGQLSVSTMHLAKGLEFRAVAVMACDDEVIPLQERIETAADKSELEEVYTTERHLLYVACTRARDHLLVTSVRPASEFLDDLRG